MNRTENDLRAAYTEPPGIRAAERRLIEAMSAANPMTHGPRPRGRTWAAAGAGAAVVAAVAVSVALIAPGSGGDPRPQSAGEAPASTSAPTPAHTAERPPAAEVPITAQVLVQTAVDLLPRPGKTSRYGGNFGTGFVGGQFVYDDGHGAAQIYVSVTYPTGGVSAKENGGVGPCVAGSAGCTVLPDGAHAQARQGHQYTDGRTPNAAEWDLDLVRPDGVQVSFIEWNAPAPKDAATTRQRPPFTISELTRWADSPTWQVQVSAQQANAAAGLFHADNIDAPPQNNSSKKQLQRQRTVNCQLAKKIGKPAPSYCR